MKKLYSTKSGLASLFQLRNLINRRNVSADVTKNMNASEDFLGLITTAHVIVAAMQVNGSRSMEELGAGQTSNGNCQQLSALAASVCNTLVDISYSLNSADPEKNTAHLDHIMEYARETLSLGLLFLEFKDAVREGNGMRVLRC